MPLLLTSLEEGVVLFWINTKKVILLDHMSAQLPHTHLLTN